MPDVDATSVSAAPVGLAAPLRLLVVEDDPTDLEWLEVMLKNATLSPFRTFEVASIAEAEQALRTHSFDCVLLDLSLPDSDGMATLRRALEAGPAPVVVFTRTDDLTLGMEAIHTGAQEYLVKGQASGNQVLRAALFAVGRNVARQVAAAPASPATPDASPGALTLRELRAPWVCMDTRGSVTDANDAFRDLVAAGQDDPVGSAFVRYIEPDDVARFTAAFNHLGGGRNPAFVCPLGLVGADGTNVAAVLSVTTMATTAGVQAFALVTARS